jgi:hypothetical protein
MVYLYSKQNKRYNMAELERISGKVASKRKDGKGIKVGEEWFSAFNASELDHINWKDDVEFSFARNGRFNNLKGTVKLISAGGGSSSAPAKSGGYSGVGVRAGHAWNSALQTVLHVTDKDVDLDDIRAAVLQEAIEVYKCMERFTKLGEAGAFAPEE